MKQKGGACPERSRRFLHIIRKSVVFVITALLIFGAFLSTFGFIPPVEKARATGVTYYVDTTLAGTCAGGAGTSYRIANRDCLGSDGTKAYKTFGVALTGSRVARGDTIYGRAGTYAETDISMAIGAGSGPVTITPYNGESVIIDPGTLTNYMWRNPTSGYDIIIDGGANRSLTFQNSGVSTKSIIYASGGNTTITRTVITDSANRTTSGWATENTAVGSLTLSKNLIHDMGGLLIAAQNSVASFTVNLYANQMDTVKGIILVAQAGLTLNEANNTVVRGTGVSHTLGAYANISVNSANNIFVLKTNGASNQLFSMSTTALSLWNFTNNIVWRESITDYTDYSKIISSGVYLYNIDKSNKFVNPNFTTYGTGYSNATLTLQNIATNYATGRGLNASLPSGGDYTGTAWPANDNSVGCYINPTLSPNSYPALTDKVAFAGDSIMTGSSASDAAHSGWSLFGALSGLATVNSNFGVAAGDQAAISGQTIEGAQWLIDRTIFEGDPETVFIAIGVNNLNNNSPTSATSTQLAQGVQVLFDKLRDASITPIWLGAESKIGNPPDNTATSSLNTAVTNICTTYTMSCGSILGQMMNNINWKTDYYADLTTSPHPNDAGHALIAQLAEYLYYTKHTMGTDEIDIGAGARVYNDGNFRDLNTISGNTANLSVTPQSGSFTSGEYSYWMDITNLTWNNTGTRHKVWTESSTVNGLNNTVHTVGDLEAGKYYNVKVDNVLGADITGATCTAGICLANGGIITFTYTGGYLAAHTFDIEGALVTITATAGANGSIDPTGATSVDYNSSQIYNVVPNTYYHIEDVLIDGISNGAITTYTFSNAITNHIISATFARNCCSSQSETNTVETPTLNEIPTVEETIEEITQTLHDYNISAPAASFAIPPNNTTGSTVSFDASGSTSNKEIVKYEWDFGDGTTSDKMKVEHEYKSPGRYTVTLTVTDRVGNKNTTTRIIDIKPIVPTITNIKAKGTALWIEGKADPGTTIYFSIHSNPFDGQGLANKEGYWTYYLDNASEVLGAGDHTIVASAAVKLSDNTELKGEQSKTYDFKMSVDNGKLKVEMAKTMVWQIISAGLVLLIIVGFIILRVRRRR